MFADTYIISNSVIINGNGATSKGSGKIIEKVITPKAPFNKINIDMAGDVLIENSSKNSIKVEIDDNLIDKVLVYVKNHTLFIKLKGTIIPTKGLYITINSRLLKELNLSSALDLTVKGYRLSDLSLNINGASDIIFNSNYINRLDIDAKGSYNINLLKSEVDSAYIRADGSGDIKIDIKSYMDISAQGTVEVQYMGNPKIRKNIEGVAELIKIK